eukprot:Hpha_TRINITY_DN10817_c0_g1::TRINITY_DN10817_c0_g1_i1::g.23294::m.23294
MMYRQLAISSVALLFGAAMMTTGFAVYKLGKARLEGATQGLCKITAAKQLPCTYKCNAQNCTGDYHTYMATSTPLCGAATLRFSEQEETRYQAYVGFLNVQVHKSTVAVCRCSGVVAGGCYVGLPVFEVGGEFTCTVDDGCKTFALQDPNNDIATGILNMVLGLIFSCFGVAPTQFAQCIGSCVTQCLSVVVPLLARFAHAVAHGVQVWLNAVTNFTSQPASRYPLDMGGRSV